MQITVDNATAYARVYVYGDYGLETSTLLKEFTGPGAIGEAIDFAKRYCRRNKGGFESVEVVTFSQEGEVNCEYVATHWR